MKFTKRQLEIVANALALVENDYDGKLQAEHQLILGKLQAKGIWGVVD